MYTQSQTRRSSGLFWIGLLLPLLALLAGAQPVEAKPEYLEVLTQTYKSNAKLEEKACSNCHLSESDYSQLNSYAKKISASLHAANTSTLTADMLNKVGSPDDAANAAAPAETAAPAPPKPKPLVPKNAFHPAIVHFPIALFLAGIFLDFLGMWKNHRTLLLAGWYNLLLGAVSTLASVASGVVAMVFMKLPYKGLIFNHLLLVGIGTVIMWAMVALRYNRHEKMSTPLRIVYYLLAAAGCVLIAWGAHLGGDFVYGS